MRIVLRPTAPGFWRNVMAVIALGKAAVVGGGLGIAALGLFDIATSDHIRAMVDTVTHNHALETCSAAGGFIGFATRLALSVLR